MLRQMAAQVAPPHEGLRELGICGKGPPRLGPQRAVLRSRAEPARRWPPRCWPANCDLDLYRIDLSAVVSKYIGETEKNLRQVFDAAEDGGVLLLFDEADALFGKRGEVKDSHDRYANIEVGYLLQRMESFQGLAILTTNLKSSLDKAFQRRLRFTVDFPFPDAAQREAIWSRVFPGADADQGSAARSARAAQHDRRQYPQHRAERGVSGGRGRRPVEMAHVLQATRMEADKIERPLSDAEIRGWV